MLKNVMQKNYSIIGMPQEQAMNTSNETCATPDQLIDASIRDLLFYF